MKKVLVFSDSHGRNSTMKMIKNKEKADIVIHAGDHCLTDVCSVYDYVDYFVAGNNDYVGSQEEIIDIEGFKIVLNHGWKYQNFNKDIWEKNLFSHYQNLSPDMIIYGHSHVESFTTIDNTIILNPGSIELPRNKSNQQTYAVFHIDNGKIVENSFDEVIKYI